MDSFDETTIYRMLFGTLQMIVSHPDQVLIEKRMTSGELHFSIWVNFEDVGSVLGRKGQTFRSLQTVVKAAAQRLNIIADIHLELGKRPIRDAR